MSRPREPEDRDLPAPGEVVDRRTGRWRGAAALALLSGAVGVVAGRPSILLASILGVAYAAYARGATAPEVRLDVERTLETSDADPGEEVEVVVTVRNAGEGVLADLRLVDGVPDGLAVVGGSPRHGTALRPGAAATFEYAVAAARGVHTFGPPVAVARDASGATERVTRTGPTTTLTCVPALGTATAPPLRTKASRFTGRVPTDSGGSGVEFYATREYRPGDPLSRVDWNRRARTGEFATLEFRRERAATVVVLVDARAAAYLAPDPDAPSAVERSVAGAGRTFAGLLDAGDRAGVAALAPEECWLAPGTGEDHRARARTLFGTHPALAPTPPEEPFFASVRLRRLRQRLPADAQLVFFSPLCDEYAVDLARRFEAYGHPVTAVSPDPTADATTGERLAGVERAVNLSALRGAGVRTVDWGPDEPLETAYARARRRWSA